MACLSECDACCGFLSRYYQWQKVVTAANMAFRAEIFDSQVCVMCVCVLQYTRGSMRVSLLQRYSFFLRVRTDGAFTGGGPPALRKFCQVDFSSNESVSRSVPCDEHLAGHGHAEVLFTQIPAKTTRGNIVEPKLLQIKRVCTQVRRPGCRRWLLRAGESYCCRCGSGLRRLLT